MMSVDLFSLLDEISSNKNRALLIQKFKDLGLKRMYFSHLCGARSNDNLYLILALELRHVMPK